MSFVAIWFRSAPITPSTTTSGPLLASNELLPRTRMRSSEPGCAFVVCTCTPDTSPEMACSIRGTGIVAICWLETDATEPVTSPLRCVP